MLARILNNIILYGIFVNYYNVYLDLNEYCNNLGYIYDVVHSLSLHYTSV